jgi:putative ABC transport system permease protein
MFDLEKAIAAWRRSLTFNRTFQAEDVDELERHLRDQVRDLVEEGMSQEAAFRRAREQFGQYGDVEREYRKVRWESLSSRGRTLEELGARWAMLMNYFRVAFRSFRRHPLYFGLNLGGLTIGMAAALLIMLFIRHENSYDAFHADADRIYRVVHGVGTTYQSAMLAPTLRADFSEIEAATRISERWFEVRVTKDAFAGMESDFFFVDSTFFDVFSYPLLSGEPDKVLDAPFSVVITESTARTYFGEEDPVGQVLKIRGLGTDYYFTVTGIAADMRGDSHFNFDLIASFSTRYRTNERRESIDSWMHSGDRTYIKLAPGSTIDPIASSVLDFAKRHLPDTVEKRGKDAAPMFAFQPIQDIHLHSDIDNEFGPNGDPSTLRIFGIVALLIILIAWLNYVNMSTARYAARAREVGVRKVVGANRTQLASQFMIETGLIMISGIGLAFLVAWLALPAFGQLVGRVLEPSRLLDAGFFLALLSLLGLSIVLAGVYPALILARVRPAQTVKGLVGERASNTWLRKSLVFSQFALSVLLVFGTGIMHRQLDYLQSKRLGMNPDQVIIVENDGGLSSQTDDTFKSQLLGHPGIVSVSAISADFPLEADQTSMLMENRPQFPIPEEELAKRVFHTTADTRILETMEIDLIEGRGFREGEDQFDRDREQLPTIINRKAVEVLGWDDPIGQTFECCFSPTPVVVGVMEDFHFESAKKEIAPLAISPSWHSRRILVRIRPEETPQAIEHISDVWKELAPGWPLQWDFMNDRFAAAYTAEQRLARSFKLFSILAVIIACLGLFGLSTLMVHSRVREIGIRKVVGASAERVVGLLMGDLLRPILLALIVAMPLAWWLASRWLQDFPYRIDLGIAPFAQTAVLTLLVAVVTISWHTWRAAHINPADAIRYE